MGTHGVRMLGVYYQLGCKHASNSAVITDKSTQINQCGCGKEYRMWSINPKTNSACSNRKTKKYMCIHTYTNIYKSTRVVSAIHYIPLLWVAYLKRRQTHTVKRMGERGCVSI